MYEVALLAKKSIYLEMYIFTDDMDEFNFVELFKNKAKAGLRVKIILDSYGSSNLSKKAIGELKSAGVELLFISHFFHHTHRKVLIIDERIAFVGGVNFHQSAAKWSDLTVKMEGKIVSFIMRSFSKAYLKCGGKDTAILKYFRKRKKIIPEKVEFWLVEHFPMYRENRLKKIYQQGIGKSEKFVYLVTPYFMPKRWFSALLHQATLRGVKVEIIVPKVTDHYFVDRMNYFFMYRLAKLGVNFYLENEMNHAKLMIVDKKFAMIGSQNLDYLSFDLNSELGVFLREEKEIVELSHIFENWKENGSLFDFKLYRPSFFDYLLSPIMRLFAILL